MVDQDNQQIEAEEGKINQVQKFTKKQALDELSKARPVATVFFRFSHRDDQNAFMLVEEQKSLVEEIRRSIKSC